MPAASLILSAALASATAAGFAIVGSITSNRSARTPSWLASFAFSGFWFSAAIVAGSQALRLLAAVLGVDSMALIVGIEQASTPFYCMAAASLLYYVLFLLTGNARLATPVAVYYLALYPVLRYHVARAGPVGYVVTDWQVNYVYAQPLQWWGYSVTLALIVLPVLLAVIAYSALALSGLDAPTRYRLVCVSIGLTFWIGIEALTFSTGLAATTSGEILRRSLGLFAAGAVLMGYLPPAFARRRWGAARLA